jgi:DnaK suppressor protein
MAAKKAVSKPKKPVAGRKAAPATKVAKAAARSHTARKATAPVAKVPVAKKAVTSPARPAGLKLPAAKPFKPVTAIATMKSPPLMPMPAGDDGDGLDSGSLLAGPRNVKPYVVKRGERYMSHEQLGHFQQILNNWKRDLMVEVDRTVTHMKDEAANFPDPNDRATQEEEFSLELRTRDRERKLIRKIDEALKRIEDGSYGYCLETGEEIGIKRLEARPVATLTIEAQERRERRERQYGDRDDRYR